MSKEFRDKHRGQSEYSYAYKKDLEKDRAAQEKEWSKGSGYYSSSGPSSGSSSSGPKLSWKEEMNQLKALEEQTRQEIARKKRAEEEREQRIKAAEDHEALIKKQTKALETGKTEGMKVIAVSSFYEQGKKLEGSGEPKTAVKFYWKALACGHKEAAYELYQVFHTGAGGIIRKNEKAAETFLSVGKKMGDPECIKLCTKNEFTLQEIHIGTFCKAAARDHKGLVTKEIMETRLAEVNQELNIDELINAPVEVAGEHSKCLVM